MTPRVELRFPHLESPGPITKWPWSDDDLPSKDPRIRRAVELLKQEHPFGSSEIAPMLNLSVSRFRHLFKKELNVSPTQYLKLARLEQAKSLIESSFLRIKEVACLVGLNDVSHFVRDYKARYGQTPTETRMSAGKRP